MASDGKGPATCARKAPGKPWQQLGEPAGATAGKVDLLTLAVQDESVYLAYNSLKDGRGRVIHWNVSAPGWRLVGPDFYVPAGPQYNLVDLTLAVNPATKGQPWVAFHVRCSAARLLSFELVVTFVMQAHAGSDRSECAPCLIVHMRRQLCSGTASA